MQDRPPAASRVSLDELARDRWVLLQPPSAFSWFWWRAAAVAVPAVTVLLLAYSPDGLAARPLSRWVALLLGVLLTCVGGVLLWRAAARPREITAEVNRLLPARRRGEWRRIERALRRGEAIVGVDRPAAAAYTAMATHQVPPGQVLCWAGFMVSVLSRTATGIEVWLFPALAVLAVPMVVLVACRARTLQEAARRAGVAPAVSDVPQVPPRVR